MIHQEIGHKCTGTYDNLNFIYGHKGRTFKKNREAHAFKKSLAKEGVSSYVTRIRNYKDKDISLDPRGLGFGVVNEDADDRTECYLVTILNQQLIKQ